MVPGLASSVISASPAIVQSRADRRQQPPERLGRKQARRAAAQKQADDRAARRPADAARPGRSAAHRGRPAAAAPACSVCELKSQYGHLRTHQGKCRYSASGGALSGPCVQARDQRAQRRAAMTERILLHGAQLGGRALKPIRNEIGVVAKAPAPARLVRPMRPSQLPCARSGRGSSAPCAPAPARSDSARCAARRARSASAPQQLPVVVLVARFGTGEARRPDARPPAQGIDLEARVVGQGRKPGERGRVTRLEQGIVLEGVAGFGDAGECAAPTAAPARSRAGPGALQTRAACRGWRSPARFSCALRPAA